MSRNRISLLLQGCPATSERGFAGLSSIALVEAGSLRILFDTGSIGDHVGLINALDERGLAPSDIDVVVLSHLHFDHAGNAELFQAARVILHDEERLNATGLGGSDPGYSAQITHAVLSMPGLELMSEGKLLLSEGVSIVRTPGHTPGSISLMVSTAQGTIGLTGDTLKNRADLERGHPIPTVPDFGQWKSSIDLLTAMCVVLYPGHDTTLRLHQGMAQPLGPVWNPVSLPAYAGGQAAVEVGM